MPDADCKLAGKEMVQILKAAPLLQVLEVRDHQPRFISDDFLEAFSQLSPSGTPVLCPNLQTICFRYFPSIKLMRFALVLALRARGSPDTQEGLHTVIVVYTSDQATAVKKLRTSAEWCSLRDASIDLQVRDVVAHAEWS
ncbi:hypothetical protein FIBSPDRAFT_970018 [Athelia psychrophila]|uniref:F-box domain-containing protein n=1 Tax=Athelia psychrophila TaxID=1759441 RepID=A0A167SZR0_9AGAM|nr:hypothetical protein FIBSPDRAFT_970018 [Fibularhizoctonia sp. CBS 109695]